MSDSTDEPVIIDYTKWFPNALLAQGKGTNFMVLTKLDKPYHGRADGKPALYELEDRWLSKPCQDTEDEAYVCVRGSELTFWQRKELPKKLLPAIEAETANLFEHFRQF